MAQEYPTKTARVTVSEDAATDDEPVSNPSKHDGSRSNGYDDDKDHQDINSCAANAAKHLARNPCSYFLVALVSTLAVSVVGFIVGDFTVSADNTGWISRGTSIADQTTQILLLNRADRQNNNADNDGTTFSDNEALWVDLTTNVQDGFESESTEEEDDDGAATTAEEGEEREERRRRRQLATTATRQLQQTTTAVVPTGFLACEATSFYLYNPELPFLSGTNLWPVWKAESEQFSLLDPAAIEDICTAEQNTQQLLQENGLCGGCSDNDICFPPVSLVLLVRFYVMDYESKLSCPELAQRWATIRSTAEAELVDLVNMIRTGNVTIASDSGATAAAFGSIIAFLVDNRFGVDGNPLVRYSTSIFSTAWAGKNGNDSSNSTTTMTKKELVDGLFALRDGYDRSSASDSVVAGAYDTANEDFLDIVVDELVVRDMTLAVASAIVTTLAMFVHTRSPWLTFIGLAQIIISFPLAFFFYNIVLRLTFFPFLNFIGVFITFALGADDVFVAVDKWKNARLEYPNASIEFIAVKSLPDAAQAMFLTSITTAVAFFSTAICPTTALKMFAIFLGLLIMFDYILCVLLVFPALCLYDRWNRPGCCRCLVAIGTCGANKNSEVKKESFIRRILSAYYEFMHRFRFFLVIVILGLSALCAVVAAKLDLPTTSEVRLLSKSNELEQVYHWKFNLFAAELDRKEGSRVWAVWGLQPTDNGSPTDPTKSSTLVLDEGFDPSPEQNQLHLLQFCDDLFQQPFYTEVEGSLCSMRRFDAWLTEQSVSNSSSTWYSASCGGASAVPVPPDSFHACMIGFARDQSETGVFYRNDKVTIIRTVYRHIGVAYDSAFDIIDEAWKSLSTFLEDQNAKAPEGVNKVFASSLDFWWYDTNGSILSSALGSIAVALAAAFVVLLFSSRSFEITLLAIFTIGFILASVTALLVATGWTLGFLESVCFAILVGMSCDFVLHFGHAYSHRPGSVSRHERTREALILMGPSILAAAVTTIAAALVMMFTKIIFFQRFAVILFYSLIMGLVGAVFVFLVLTDTIGPAEPTVLIDSWLRCGAKKPEEVVLLPTRDNKTPSTDKAAVHKKVMNPVNVDEEVYA